MQHRTLAYSQKLVETHLSAFLAIYFSVLLLYMHRTLSSNTKHSCVFITYNTEHSAFIISTEH